MANAEVDARRRARWSARRPSTAADSAMIREMAEPARAKLPAARSAVGGARHIAAVRAATMSNSYGSCKPIVADECHAGNARFMRLEALPLDDEQTMVTPICQ